MSEEMGWTLNSEHFTEMVNCETTVHYFRQGISFIGQVFSHKQGVWLCLHMLPV